MMMRILTALICLVAFSGSAYAFRPEFEQWLPKGFVVREIREPSYSMHILPKDAAAQLDELDAFNKKLSELEKRKFHLYHASGDDDLSKAQQNRASADYDKVVAEIKEMKADKVKRFGPNADKLAESLVKKGERLSDAWHDMAKKTIQRNIDKEPPPLKSAAFSKAEEAVAESGEKFLKSMKAGNAFSRARLGKAGKAAVIAVPAAAVGAVMMKSEAQAGAVHDSDLPNKDDVESRQQQDIEVLDAK